MNREERMLRYGDHRFAAVTLLPGGWEGSGRPFWCVDAWFGVCLLFLFFLTPHFLLYDSLRLSCFTPGFVLFATGLARGNGCIFRLWS